MNVDRMHCCRTGDFFLLPRDGQGAPAFTRHLSTIGNLAGHEGLPSKAMPGHYAPVKVRRSLKSRATAPTPECQIRLTGTPRSGRGRTWTRIGSAPRMELPRRESFLRCLPKGHFSEARIPHSIGGRAALCGGRGTPRIHGEDHSDRCRRARGRDDRGVHRLAARHGGWSPETLGMPSPTRRSVIPPTSAEVDSAFDTQGDGAKCLEERRRFPVENAAFTYSFNAIQMLLSERYRLERASAFSRVSELRGWPEPASFATVAISRTAPSVGDSGLRASVHHIGLKLHPGTC